MGSGVEKEKRQAINPVVFGHLPELCTHAHEKRYHHTSEKLLPGIIV